MINDSYKTCLVYVVMVYDDDTCLVYVDMGLSSNNPVVLTVVTAGQSFSRTFSIKITQIECDSLAKGSFLERFIIMVLKCYF